MKGIALIPSKNFKKLTIITESSLHQCDLKQLTDALGSLKQKIAVEVRCERLILFENEGIKPPFKKLEFGGFKGFRGVLDDQQGEHKHLKLMGKSVEHRIDLFAREIEDFNNAFYNGIEDLKLQLLDSISYEDI